MISLKMEASIRDLCHPHGPRERPHFRQKLTEVTTLFFLLRMRILIRFMKYALQCKRKEM